MSFAFSDLERQAIRVDGERLYRSLQDLGRIGGYYDGNLSLHGVNRMALSTADGEARRQVVSWMELAGMQVEVDSIGNFYGHLPGRDSDAAPVMMGSHIDSVPTAGIFDGCLGVLAGIEVVRTIQERELHPRRGLVVGVFTEEEGCRFGTDMLGSAVATGRIPLETAYELRDNHGLRLVDELEAIGFLGRTAARVQAPHAFLELHIEQGPLLRKREVDIGVVTGVQAISWYELTIVGRSAHAGTTPMEMRRDPGIAAARINLELRRMIDSGDYGRMRATMGVSRLVPGRINIVPGRCLATVDLRNPDDELMRAAERDLLAFFDRVSEEEQVEIQWRQTARTETVDFPPALQAHIRDAAEVLGLSQMPIISGAGHDAQEFARVCPTAMIFVPGEHDGISHNPREYSSSSQCEHGANVLLYAALALANQA
ncbi:M20 family metallo-hydrolase [Haliangium ochraceum]|uniref:Amidase, hydantoinase/carbamoylase family n=1 Tax=Haliangium ochraceum (strain DSM 14365 / JCM 11303 / SMP-2) TaxID=502025 RepID=D0LT00_HALO1|nr:M20 family metallo-hydrolase [Haliangium ochraceum]ACY19136.1 amidase, hydantoinase/carbamoylase family [Haliangium ochraceum DSM 14365]